MEKATPQLKILRATRPVNFNLWKHLPNANTVFTCDWNPTPFQGDLQPPKRPIFVQCAMEKRPQLLRVRV